MPTIIVSYRRSDSKWITGRIVDRLERDLGKGDVFVDIDAIPLGMDFRDHLRNVLDQCDVLLAVIGPNWLAAGETGQPRIFEPTDWVRIEIETALAKGIPVVPVLIDRAPMPKVSDLPESLHAFAFRQAADVDSGRDFHVHMDRLVRAISQSAAAQRQVMPDVAERQGQTPPPEPALPAHRHRSPESEVSTSALASPDSEAPFGEREGGGRRIGIVLAVVGALGAFVIALTIAQMGAGVTTVPKSEIQDRTTQDVPDDSTQPSLRAWLFDEDQKQPNGGTRFNGQVRWRAEKVASSPGQLAALAARADIVIPDRPFELTWTLRNNTDVNLPASHTIEFKFNLPAQSANGGIADVPRIWMKGTEQALMGVQLEGHAVKVTTNFFLIGLSAVGTEQTSNIRTLKEYGWFTIPLVYSNGRQASLTMEKGASGDRVFKDVFASWDQ
jgi:hypothetical protein